jgi:hypothetical protein
MIARLLAGRDFTRVIDCSPRFFTIVGLLVANRPLDYDYHALNLRSQRGCGNSPPDMGRRCS